MAVDLGKVGENLDQWPAINIDITGKGSIAEKIISELQNIQSQRPLRQEEDIVNDYIRFSEPLHEFLGENKLHQENVKKNY